MIVEQIITLEEKEKQAINTLSSVKCTEARCDNCPMWVERERVCVCAMTELVAVKVGLR